METWDKSKTEAHKPASLSIVCGVSSHMFNFQFVSKYERERETALIT